MKKINLIIPILVSIVSLVSAHPEEETGYNMMDGMYGMMSGSYGYGGLFFGWLSGLLITVVLLLLIIWLIKQIQKK